jgi:DNA-binding XRE family transcriptional regulator
MTQKKSSAHEALGRAMRCARQERGQSQEAFAAHAGLDRANYGAIERGEFNVTVDTVVKIGAGLGITAGELFARARLCRCSHVTGRATPGGRGPRAFDRSTTAAAR